MNPSPILRIISGGQTGADQGGLRAGAALGLDTGGWIPFGFRTDTGADCRPRPAIRPERNPFKRATPPAPTSTSATATEP